MLAGEMDKPMLIMRASVAVMGKNNPNIKPASAYLCVALPNRGFIIESHSLGSLSILAFEFQCYFCCAANPSTQLLNCGLHYGINIADIADLR